MRGPVTVPPGSLVEGAVPFHSQHCICSADTLLPVMNELLMPPTTPGPLRAGCGPGAQPEADGELLPLAAARSLQSSHAASTFFSVAPGRTARAQPPITPAQIYSIQNISCANIPVTVSTPKARSAPEKEPSLATSCQQRVCDQLCLSLASGFHHSNVQNLQA